MLIKSISTETDSKSENNLLVTVECKQVQFVNTRVIDNPANQKTPATTGKTVDQGTKNVVSSTAAALGR